MESVCIDAGIASCAPGKQTQSVCKTSTVSSVCKTCNETKPIKDFVPGFATFYMCKSCAAARQRRKVNCPVCDKSISYGNLSKHTYTHSKPPKAMVMCC